MGDVRARLIGAAAMLCFAAAFGARAATNTIPGRVLYFSMDELKSGAFVDGVTSNALGRAVNAKTTSNGKLASACEFASKSSYVEVPDQAALNPKRLTVALWFRMSKDAWVTRTLLEKGGEKGYALSIAGGGKESARRGKLRASVNGKDVLSAEAVNSDAWRHAAVTYDGQTVKLYIDGVLQPQTAAAGGDLPPSSQPLTLGMNRSAPSSQEKEQALDGLLDEVMLFSRALDAQEIKRVMALARPKFTKSQVERRLKELKELYDRGLLTQAFYDRKVEECEVVE